MNQKTVKLLKKYANKTGFPYKEMKREYKELKNPIERYKYKEDLKKTLYNI
jgi:hypothetical protein